MATGRYFVRDVDAGAAFYTDLLDFELLQQVGPNMAILTHGDLSLWVAGPNASASKAMPDGRKPEPGGWNRFVLEVGDLDSAVATLRASKAVFRNDIVSGPGGKQILVEDPFGNVVELFQAAELGDAPSASSSCAESISTGKCARRANAEVRRLR